MTLRGISLNNLLNFYLELGSDTLFPVYKVEHTTEDVTREAILPRTMTNTGGIAYAEINGKHLAERMVTHHWKNTFHNLVAAIVADAMDDPLYSAYSRDDLREAQKSKNKDLMYWICPFSVNQHRSICKHEWFTKNREKCKCKLKVYGNDHPACEVDKFDDMINHLVEENLRQRKKPRHHHLVASIVADAMDDLFYSVYKRVKTQT